MVAIWQFQHCSVAFLSFSDADNQLIGHHAYITLLAGDKGLSFPLNPHSPLNHLVLSPVKEPHPLLL